MRLGAMLVGVCLWCSCAGSGDEASTSPATVSAVEVREDGVVLSPDFAPIPFVQFGRTASEIDASAQDPECPGWIARQPGHVLRLQAAFGALRLTARAAREEDLILVLERPDGSQLCADDGNGLDPVLETALDAGVYRLWIGTLEPSAESHAYTLGISRGGLVPGLLPPPPPDPSRLFPSVSTWTAGSPDEEIHVVFESGLAGGRVEADELGEHCTGWISERPDFGVGIRDATGRDELDVHLRCRTGVGLVMMLPDGSRICGPLDGEGEERTLTISPVVAGTHYIWLSSPDQDRAYDCRIQLGG